jgi:hypothetical protein
MGVSDNYSRKESFSPGMVLCLKWLKEAKESKETKETKE